MLLGGQKQVVVGLTALLDVDLDVGMFAFQMLQEAVELGAVAADEHRQEAARLGEQACDDCLRHGGEVITTRDRLPFREAEPVALRDREAVQLTSRDARVTSPVATCAIALRISTAFSAAVREPS